MRIWVRPPKLQKCEWTYHQVLVYYSTQIPVLRLECFQGFNHHPSQLCDQYTPRSGPKTASSPESPVTCDTIASFPSQYICWTPLARAVFRGSPRSSQSSGAPISKTTPTLRRRSPSSTLGTNSRLLCPLQRQTVSQPRLHDPAHGRKTLLPFPEPHIIDSVPDMHNKKRDIPEADFPQPSRFLVICGPQNSHCGRKRNIQVLFAHNHALNAIHSQFLVYSSKINISTRADKPAGRQTLITQPIIAPHVRV